MTTGSSILIRDGEGHSLINQPIAIAIYGFALGVFLSLSRLPSGTSDDEPLDTPLCGACLRPYREGAHFCPSCSSPTTGFAATAEYESAQAQAWIFGKALKHPTRRIHVIAVQLICLPVIIGAPVLMFGLWTQEEIPGYTLIDWLGWWMIAFLPYAVMLMICIENWKRYEEDPESVPSESDYGSPPWWTYDRWWTVPDVEDEGEQGAEPEDSDSNRSPPDES